MAKISVVLNCRMDNGKDVKQPGSTVSMDEKEAVKLAGMGMVSYSAPENKPAKSSGRGGKEEKGDEAEGGFDPDALDRGGAADDNGEGNENP
ncbi:hypothetical protein [Desulfovibrio sp. QI0442]